MEKLELLLIDMQAEPDDVNVDILGPYEGSLLDFYQDVRDRACEIARNSSERNVVEMEPNEEGYPCASIYNEKGTIYRQIFASKDGGTMANRALKTLENFR